MLNSFAADVLITPVVLAIYSWILFVPGCLIVTVLRLRHHRFLLSYGISLIVLVFSLSIALFLNIELGVFVGSYIGITIAVPVVCLVSLLIWKDSRFYYDLKIGVDCRHLIRSGCVPLAIVVVYSAYHFSVGPYTEIPSDFWKHLARTVHLFLSLAEYGNEELSSLGFSQGIEYDFWYLTNATVARLLGIHPLEAVNAVTLITGSCFLLSTYFFTIRVCEPLRLTRRQKVVAATLASFLTLMTFGTATYSYVRYYAYSPAIVAFPLVYLSVSYLLDYLEQPKSKGNRVLIGTIVVVLAGIIHLQEALFCLLLGLGILAVRFIRLGSSRLVGGAKRTKMNSTVEYRTFRLGALSFVAIFIVVILIASTTEIHSWRGNPHIKDLGEYLPIFSGHPIANPFFRFWDTVGLFGVFVYFWYLFRQKWLRQIDYLTAAMLMPFFTFFNPFYSDLFLRINEASVLWRPTYLIPFSVVAGILFVATDQMSAKNALSQRLVRVAPFIVFCLAAMVPFESGSFVNRTSRVPSLIPVDSRSGAGHWRDLIKQIDSLQKGQVIRRIASDQITSFVLYSANKGRITQFNSGEYFPNNNSVYRDDMEYSDQTDSLLIINRRNGFRTQSTRWAHHWPDYVLDTSILYPDDIDDYVADTQEIKLLWNFNRISTYLLPRWNPGKEMEE